MSCDFSDTEFSKKLKQLETRVATWAFQCIEARKKCSERESNMSNYPLREKVQKAVDSAFPNGLHSEGREVVTDCMLVQALVVNAFVDALRLSPTDIKGWHRLKRLKARFTDAWVEIRRKPPAETLVQRQNPSQSSGSAIPKFGSIQKSLIKKQNKAIQDVTNKIYSTIFHSPAKKPAEIKELRTGLKQIGECIGELCVELAYAHGYYFPKGKSSVSFDERQLDEYQPSFHDSDDENQETQHRQIYLLVFPAALRKDESRSAKMDDLVIRKGKVVLRETSKT